jgi:putative addiction module killer protein
MNMEVKARQVAILRLDDDSSPFEEWLDGIKDSAFVRAVDARITRIRDGNFGDHKRVGEGVYELRIDKGPGLRVFYALDGEDLVLLLGGADKSSQRKKIEEAKILWRKYKNEN